MKTLRFYVALLTVALVFIAARVLTQTPAPTDSSVLLAEAIALLAEDKPQDALAVIDGISATDAAYNVAQSYKALCLYALGDKKGFWKTLDPKPVRDAIPAAIKEDVWVKQMDAFLQFGKFESLTRKLNEFAEGYPASARMAQVEQYQLAGLFEKGRKVARDAFRSTEDERFDAHWRVAQTNLQQFVQAAARFSDYTALPGRSLQDDVWVARLLLGEEAALLAEVTDKAGQEQLTLLRLELAVDLERESVDANLERLEEFLSAFPEPAERERVEKAAAILHFRKGRQLALSGEAEQAREYFAAQRALEDQDVAMLEDRLYSLMLEADFKTLAALTTAVTASSSPGELEWMEGKLFDAFGAISQARTNEAVVVLDDVIGTAATFKDDKAQDRLLLNAVKWQIHLALASGDRTKAETLARWVQHSDCPKHYKFPFLKDHLSLLAEGPLEGGVR